MVSHLFPEMVAEAATTQGRKEGSKGSKVQVHMLVVIKQ
jgi:hypothetical protein